MWMKAGVVGKYMIEGRGGDVLGGLGLRSVVVNFFDGNDVVDFVEHQIVSFSACKGGFFIAIPSLPPSLLVHIKYHEKKRTIEPQRQPCSTRLDYLASMADAKMRGLKLFFPRIWKSFRTAFFVEGRACFFLKRGVL